MALRITKSQGEAVRLVKEGERDATVVAVHKVNDLDYYSLGLTELAAKLGKTPPKLLKLIEHDLCRTTRSSSKKSELGATLRSNVIAAKRLRI
jgi:hypothetical protein